MILAEEELRAFIGRLLRGEGEEDDEQLLASDAQLLQEVQSRLERCGVKLIRNPDTPPRCVIAEPQDALPELPLACLALCALALHPSRAPASKQPRITVHDIWRRLGKRQGFTEAYVRRAGLGPLEARGYIKVIKPEQRASEAYVKAGPTMAAVDVELLEARVRALKEAAA
jgi:hypothetical protein